MLARGKLTEALARIHFERARRHAEHGFHYDAVLDHYDCPQGERLTLHLVHREQKTAVYRAPASSCAGCPLKAACMPHDEGRHIYRPLAEWTETEANQFHQLLSLLIVASGAVISLAAFARGAGRPGSGLLLIALSVIVSVVIRDACWIGHSSWRSDADLEQPGG